MITLLCRVASAEESESIGAIRNDVAATLFPAANGGVSNIAVDSHGRQYLAPDGVTPPISTGSNTIGSIAAITTSVVPGTAPTNLGKAEDDVHTSGDVGVALLAVREDAVTLSTSNSGDYANLKTDAYGRLRTNSPAVADGIIAGSVLNVYKRAFVNTAAATTDGVLVAAVALKSLVVVAAAVVAGSTATTIVFNTKPVGAGTAISPVFANDINGGEVLPFNPGGWFASTTGEGLSVTTGAGSATGILVTYYEL
jgi:hypothetical protein